MSKEADNLCLFKDTDAEVELISLVYESLPRYRLKADCNIQFSGYQHSDFKRAENIIENITELTDTQIQKTLEYFLLCGLRVSKMTETYEDCAALRLLVEEQKAHMDEAANIGLNLLQRNIQLEQRLTTVEDQLSASKDTISQLRHQLHLKDDLLRLLHSEIEDAEDCNQTLNECTVIDNLNNWISRTYKEDDFESFHSFVNEHGDHPNFFSLTESNFSLDKVNLKNLESKLSKLEEENTKLRNQHNSLYSHADFMENKEQQLIDDCVRQLLDSTKTVDRLTSDLNKKTNDYLNQHEEISRLLTTNIDLENKIHRLLTENDHLISQLRDHQTKQFTLTKELTDLRDRYDECLNLLIEKQDQIRQLNKKCKKEMMKQIQGFRSLSPDIGQSLAMEFEDTSRKDTLIAEQSRAIRVMEQARTINSSWQDTDETSSGFTEDLASSFINTEAETSLQEPSGGNYLLRKSIQEDCERRRMYRNNTSDIDQSFLDSQIEEASANTVASYCALEAFRHRQNRCQTIRSLNTNILNSDSQSLHPQNIYKMPDKLQLVKPIEGSQTLRTWQNLATPSITKALFEEQSQSVCFRGQQPLMLSPSPSSPNSEHSPQIHQSLHSSLVSSDCDDADYDDPINPIQSASFTSNTSTYSTAGINQIDTNSKYISNISSENITHRKDNTSAFNLNFQLNEKGTKKTIYHDNTPVNEVSSFGINEEKDYSLSRTNDVKITSIDNPTVDSQRTLPSWLDRLTVKSIMNNILGYPLPHLHKAITNSPYATTTVNQKPITSSFVSSANCGSSSIISRLTNLPPLAQRRFPQSGLNLLATVSNSQSNPNSVLHRISNFCTSAELDAVTDDDSSSPRSNVSQID